MRLFLDTPLVAFATISVLAASPAFAGESPDRRPRPAPDSVTMMPAALRDALHFGMAVAVVGQDLVVGRPGAAARAGSPVSGVHIFRRLPSGRWTERAVLAPSDAGKDDELGAVLAADGQTLAIGAPQAKDGRGAVYLFERTPQGRWIQRTKLVAAAAQAGERFGAVLALRGDVLLVGAPAYAKEQGRVVLFRRGSTGQWTEQATLTAADTSHMAFGRALTLADGRVFVAAPGSLPRWIYDKRADRDAAPRVFVFRDSAGTWRPEATLNTAGDSSLGQNFGTALLANGADLLISSPDNSTVFHFRRDGAGQWTKTSALTSGAGTNNEFGAALVQSGRDLFIGAPRTSNGPADPATHVSEDGAVYIFRYDSAAASWTKVGQVALADSSLPYRRFANTSARLGEKLAVGRDFVVAGLPAMDNMEGAAAVLSWSSASNEWRHTATVVDTAWSTRRPLTGKEMKCQKGRILIFECQNADLVAYLPLTAIGGGRKNVQNMVSGIWGWIDSTTGREFAMVGRSDGAAFVEVTDPVHPKYLGELPLHQGASPSPWRDMKVYKNHAFIVSDGAGPHGMQVFDLTQLRNVKHPPVVFQETAHYDRVASVHTLASNEETGFLYSAGSNSGGESCGGALHMTDVRDPLHPKFAGCYAGPTVGDDKTTGIHETQCVVYRGPDAQYKGKEICLNSSGNALAIVDVTDKQQPKRISVATYPKIAYAHQGWLSQDQRYFFLNDEIDEIVQWRERGFAETRTRTIVFDVSTLSDPVVVKEFFGTTAVTDHNLYIRGHYMYQANYKAGLRFVDIADPTSPKEVGYFDTAPAFDKIIGFAGAWTNYPYFKGGVIGVASISEGLFLIRFRPATRP